MTALETVLSVLFVLMTAVCVALTTLLALWNLNTGENFIRALLVLFRFSSAGLMSLPGQSNLFLYSHFIINICPSRLFVGGEK